MINAENGKIEIKGHGAEVSEELGNIMNYFLKECTESEMKVMLSHALGPLSISDTVRFYKCLQKVTGVEWTFTI